MNLPTGTRRAAHLVRFAVAAAVLFVLGTTATRADHNFRIYNNGDHTIIEVHISGVDYSKWGPDLLGEDEVIRPGEYENFTIVQGCEEDIKLVYRDDVRVSRDFDTCEYDLKAEY
jgi:hypothetical protein